MLGIDGHWTSHAYSLPVDDTLVVQCFIFTDDTNCLYLKLSPSLQEPPIVQDHHVPIFICSKDDIATCSDLTIQQVTPVIL